MKYLRLMLSALAVFMFSTLFAQQKNQGVISGIIKDAKTKSPITEAVVTLSSSAFTGQKFALTDSAGMYKVTNLPAGNYTINFEMEGYEKYKQDSIVVLDGAEVTIDYDMAKGKKKNKKAQVQVANY